MIQRAEEEEDDGRIIAAKIIGQITHNDKEAKSMLWSQMKLRVVIWSHSNIHLVS
jgi:hypothetical protein